jgi:HAMP domain-containing protein
MMNPRTAGSRRRPPSLNVSLRTILITAFSALVIGAGATVGLLAFHASKEAVSSMAEHLLAEIADRIDQRVAVQIAELRQVVRTNADLIRRGLLDWQDGPALERHFAEQLELFSGVTTIAQATERREFRLMMRAGPDTRILRRMDASSDFRLNRYRADAQGQPVELLETRDNFDPHNDPPDNPLYRSVRESGEGRWNLSVSLGLGQTRPELIGHYSQPFYDPSGVMQGVLNAGMSLTDIGDFLEGLKISANGKAFIIDREGLVIATSSGETPFDNRPLPDHAQNVSVEHRRLAAIASADPVMAAAAATLLADETGLARLSTPRRFILDVAGQPYLLNASPLVGRPTYPDWIALVAAPLHDFAVLTEAHARRGLLLILSALVIAILLGLAAAGWISRPLQQLNAATKRLADGDFDQSLPRRTDPGAVGAEGCLRGNDRASARGLRPPAVRQPEPARGRADPRRGEQSSRRARRRTHRRVGNGPAPAP